VKDIVLRKKGEQVMAKKAEWEKEVERTREEYGIRYISHVPKKIPPGRVLMHNHIMHGPNWPSGINGFRFWTGTKPYDGFVPCPCGWAGLKHYAAKPYVTSYRNNPEKHRRWVRAEEKRWKQFKTES
jgi:hypothetical protein